MEPAWTRGALTTCSGTNQTCVQGANRCWRLRTNARSMPNRGTASASVPRSVWISLLQGGQRQSHGSAPRSPSTQCFDRGQISCRADNISSTLHQSAVPQLNHPAGAVRAPGPTQLGPKLRLEPHIMKLCFACEQAPFKAPDSTGPSLEEVRIIDVDCSTAKLREGTKDREGRFTPIIG